MEKRSVPNLTIAVTKLAGVALLLGAAPANASTDAAWAASAKAGRAACVAAANLRHATISAPLRFSDQVGRDAMLVRGTYPQKFMKGAKGTMLCLYDRRTRKAEAVEAKGWAHR
jgi:hypothetical protein